MVLNIDPYPITVEEPRTWLSWRASQLVEEVIRAKKTQDAKQAEVDQLRELYDKARNDLRDATQNTDRTWYELRELIYGA